MKKCTTCKNVVDWTGSITTIDLNTTPRTEAIEHLCTPCLEKRGYAKPIIHRVRYGGKIVFQWGDPKDKELYCMCCPPYDNKVKHPHRFSFYVADDEDKPIDVRKLFWHFISSSFNNEGKRVKITFEVEN